MADVNWRAPDFLSQTTGNYPDKSDAADKDNIFLTESGWVYRHYKSLDKSKYWDEIIWSGYVDANYEVNGAKVNDPVDPINDASPTFLVGDGFQYVSGPYPATTSTIGTVEVQGAGTVDTDHAEAYTATITGSFITDGGTATYAWKVKDSAGKDVTADTNAITITGGTTATATITFKIEDNYNVSVTVGDQAGTEASQTGGLTVIAAATPPAAETITGVTIAGAVNPITDTATVYTVTYTGTATEGSTSLALATAQSGVSIVPGTQNGKEQPFTVTVADSVAGGTTFDLTCSATNADVNSGNAVAGTPLTVTSKDTIGTVTVSTTPQNPAQGASNQAITSSATGTKGTIANPTYAWTVDSGPSGYEGKVTFDSASSQNTTFDVAADAPVGDYVLTCTWGGTGIKPTTAAGSITIGVGSASTSGAPTTTYTVTVGAKTSAHPYNGVGSSNGYLLDGVEGASVSVSTGDIIRFDQSHSSNAGHPIRIYTDAAKNYPYAVGVTANGTPGTAGAYTQLQVVAVTPSTLHYQCSSHGYMGGTINKS